MTAKRKKERPPGRYRVINPRGIPAGRHIIRAVRRGKETGRWFEGDDYDGDAVEHWLERGFIERVDGGVTEVDEDKEMGTYPIEEVSDDD